MSRAPASSPWILLALLVMGGAALLFVPGWIAEHLALARSFGPVGSYLYLGAILLGGTILLGASGTIVWRLWKRTLAKRVRQELQRRNPSQLSRQEREQEIAQNLAAAADLQVNLPDIDTWRAQLATLTGQITEKREKQVLEIVAFGSISSGKSSLLNAIAGRDVFLTDAKGGTTVTRNEIPWPGVDQVVLVDTPGLGEIDGEQHGVVSADSAQAADLVLVVADGPLREWEHQLLQKLGAMEKRTLICLNKSDWYTDRERERLLSQMRSQVTGIAPADDVLSVRSQPTKRKRVRVLPDGSEQEELVDVPIDIGPLAERMLQVIRRDGHDLLLANLLLQSRGLVEESRRRVQEAIDQQAWETIDRYMWAASGAAALSPFPVLDLAAGVAISTKMVMDLARIYRQEIDLPIAADMLGQSAKQLLSILGVAAVGPAFVTAIASLLKTVPGAGMLAGGLLQGVVQALITRWIGSYFIRRFRDGMQLNDAALATVAREEWRRLTTLDELRRLIQVARTKLT